MKKFLTSILASASLFVPNAALAENTFEDHVELFNTIKDTGITVLINPKLHCMYSDIDGFYHRDAALLVVCQDNSYAGGPQVEWTANDLDTLRHEAHHVVQDCALGGIGDGRFELLFSEEGKLAEFISKSSYTEEQVEDIVSWLTDEGLSEENILMEVEAYVVAQDIDATSISNKIKEFCN
tara:strand:+ start:745 stop:1287 length:543 start_codon:yes stop_codon:yes gene_type:complete